MFNDLIWNDETRNDGHAEREEAEAEFEALVDAANYGDCD